MKRRKNGIWGEKQLKSAVGALLKETLDKSDRQLVTLITEWPLIVGEDIARYSHPNSLKRSKTDAVLRIAVESGYATFLQHELPNVQERIAQFLGAQAVTRIQLEPLVTKAATPAKRKPLKKALSEALVTNTGDAELDGALAALEQAVRNRH